MAKNTSSSAFRKIDVDEYNEDNYKEEEPSEVQSPIAGPDENEITQLLNQGRNVDALKSCLRSAPLGSKNQKVKDTALELMRRVLASIKSSQMEEAVQYLDADEIDTLMKYVYRGFELPNKEWINGQMSAHLLAWHEKVFAVGGTGCITRVLTDRKRV